MTIKTKRDCRADEQVIAGMKVVAVLIATMIFAAYITA